MISMTACLKRGRAQVEAGRNAARSASGTSLSSSPPGLSRGASEAMDARVKPGHDDPGVCHAPSLTAAACAVLRAGEPAEKVALSHRFARQWRDGSIAEIGKALPPDRPARPLRPILKPAREMVRRRGGGSLANRIALLHALAHIELNAIDLAWDLIARFAACDLPPHDGLWEAAQATAHDLLARLAIVPLVLEARGLDVTPGMIERLERHGDAASAAALQVIYDEEIGHVACGRRWFQWECARRGHEPVSAWRDLVQRHFRGALKPPFNRAAREAAGLAAAFYEGL